jgi:hypothetical protein
MPVVSSLLLLCLQAPVSWLAARGRISASESVRLPGLLALRPVSKRRVLSSRSFQSAVQFRATTEFGRRCREREAD